MPEIKTKLVIVGGGPAGLTAAIYAGRANLEPVVIVGGFEGGSMIPGGQLMITTEVENYPGFPEGINGPDLMEKFKQQAARFGGTFVEEFATGFKFTPGGPHQITAGENTYICDAVILAMGAQAKWLGAPGEDVYMNKGISACATCDGPLPLFRNKHIVVVGGGDSAVEEATFLTRFASKVSLVVRRDVLRASKIMQSRLTSNPKVTVLWNTKVAGYLGDGNLLSGVKLENTNTGATVEVEAAGVFMAIGHDACTKYLHESGLGLDEQGYIKVDKSINTTIDGVFAAGDIHDTHWRQAITASGFGCMAAIAAERWLEAKEVH